MLGNGGPHGHSGRMDLAALANTATAPDWISAISTAVIALSVVAAAVSWMRQRANQLRDPGEAPDGQEGEDREFFEDALRPIQGGSPQWWKDQQRKMTWLQRRQRRLRGRGRMKRVQERAEQIRALDEDDEE